jgi:aryl-alcohol dehydrogenase-like predicted oxidoreductase
MTRHTLGKTGLSVSALGFGAAPIGYLEVEQNRVSTILNMLLDRGLNLIDTAAVYEGSEELIGNAVSHRRHEFVLVSKCGRQAGEVKGEDWSEKLILDSVDQSLKRLKTDYLDIMLLHSCGLEVLKKGEAIGALIKARDAGKVRFPGYSGDNEAAAYAATMPQIAVIETSINICDQANIDHVLP